MNNDANQRRGRVVTASASRLMGVRDVGSSLAESTRIGGGEIS